MNNRLYALVVIGQILSGLIILPILLYFSAPYGRHFRTGWGPVIHSRIAWLVMEFPAILVIVLVYIRYADRAVRQFSWIFLVLWQVHYIYRSCIYPLLLRGSRKTFPVILACMAFVFNVMNGYINGYALFALHPIHTLRYFAGFWSILGLLLFSCGLMLNITSDAIIRGLRRNLVTGTQGYYAIPYGGFFRYVSNPHYLGEIIEWLGWALLVRTAAGWAFAWFTFTNLMPRAVLNHRWYQEHFENYPPERKILLPFIF